MEFPLKTKFLFSLLLGIFLFPVSAFAKLDVVSIKTTPDTPGPNEEVTISLSSFTSDLNSANITWYVNKEADINGSGVGKKEFKTYTHDFGDPVTIDIVITEKEGGRLDKQLVLKPMEVDLLWEANSYTPPFYKGKSLPTYKSIVRMIAIPRINTPSSRPEDYYYKWSMQGATGLGEGMGKSNALVPMGYANSKTQVRVEASIPGDTSRGSMTSYIPTVEPVLAFYEQDPLLGIRLTKALGSSVTTINKEFIVRAVPYYFSNEDMGNGTIVYTWQKDGSNVPRGFNPNVFGVRKNGEKTEATNISLQVQNSKRILQRAGNGIVINFSAK